MEEEVGNELPGLREDRFEGGLNVENERKSSPNGAVGGE